jgi:hypothetical protein
MAQNLIWQQGCNAAREKIENYSLGPFRVGFLRPIHHLGIEIGLESTRTSLGSSWTGVASAGEDSAPLRLLELMV